MRRVVITGIGVVSPLGIGTAAFWNNLLAGQVALQRIDLFDPSGFSCQIGGQVPAYKINEHVPKSYRKATNRMARDIELAVIAATTHLRMRICSPMRTARHLLLTASALGAISGRA